MMETHPQSPSKPQDQKSPSEPLSPEAGEGSFWGLLSEAFRQLKPAPLLLFALAVVAVLLMAGAMWNAEALRVLTLPFVVIALGGLVAWVVLESRKGPRAKTGSIRISGSVKGSQIKTGGIKGSGQGATGDVTLKGRGEADDSSIETGSIEK